MKTWDVSGIELTKYEPSICSANRDNANYAWTHQLVWDTRGGTEMYSGQTGWVSILMVMVF